MSAPAAETGRRMASSIWAIAAASIWEGPQTPYGSGASCKTGISVRARSFSRIRTSSAATSPTMASARNVSGALRTSSSRLRIASRSRPSASSRDAAALARPMTRPSGQPRAFNVFPLIMICRSLGNASARRRCPAPRHSCRRVSASRDMGPSDGAMRPAGLSRLETAERRNGGPLHPQGGAILLVRGCRIVEGLAPAHHRQLLSAVILSTARQCGGQGTPGRQAGLAAPGPGLGPDGSGHYLAPDGTVVGGIVLTLATASVRHPTIRLRHYVQVDGADGTGRSHTDDRDRSIARRKCLPAPVVPHGFGTNSRGREQTQVCVVIADVISPRPEKQCLHLDGLADVHGVGSGGKRRSDQNR